MPTIVTSENLAEFNQQQMGTPVAAEPPPVEVEAVEPTPAPDGSESSETKQEPSEKPPKSKHSLDERFAQLTEEKKALRAQADEATAKAQREQDARVKAENLARELRNKYEPVKTALDPKPEPEQFINTAEYGKALEEWTTEKANRDRDEREARTKVVDSWKAQEKAAKAEYPDYAEVTGASEVIVSNEMRDAIIESDVGAKLTYFFAKNPDEAERLASLSPLRMLKELGKIEDKLGTKPAAKAEAPKEAKPKVPLKSNAPEPETPLKGANSPGGPKLDSEGKFHGTYAEWKEGRRNGTIH